MDSSRFCGIICREELTPISSNQEETRWMRPILSPPYDVRFIGHQFGLQLANVLDHGPLNIGAVHAQHREGQRTATTLDQRDDHRLPRFERGGDGCRASVRLRRSTGTC